MGDPSAISKDVSLGGAAACVLTMADIGVSPCSALLRPFGLTLAIVLPGDVIPGSYWGEVEAGLIGNTLYCRPDTPVHSLLHEACHYICMTPERRRNLDRDAGGNYEEENAVCYLQIVLAEYLMEAGADRMVTDMDAWGYTFRLGSARAWFEGDAEDTRVWLKEHDLIDNQGRITWRLRD